MAGHEHSGHEDLGHEGAKESTTPGAPREREVITPDWAHLDKDAASQCVPDDTSSDASSRDGAPPSPVKGRRSIATADTSW